VQVSLEALAQVGVMANFVRVVVTVWNRQYELTARQQFKAAWIARGDFNSEPLEGRGRTPSRAAASWREQARCKSN
jgi:hypothetical protein